jgi:hypothetical protein
MLRLTRHTRTTLVDGCLFDEFDGMFVLRINNVETGRLFYADEIFTLARRG